MTERDDAQEIIHGALANVINSDEYLLSRWVLVFEAVHQEDSGNTVMYLTSPGLSTWEAVGLSSAATALAKEIIVSPIYDYDEGEDDDNV